MVEQRLTISAVGWRGEGLAEEGQQKYFVPRTLPGEEIVALTGGERARLLVVEKPSPDRREPFCPHFGDCGGCQLQHWDETPYRVWKRSLVEKAFRHHGIEAAVAGLVDAHGAGRRRASIHVRRKEGSVLAGFMSARSHAIVDIDACPVLVPGLANAMAIARALGECLGNCDVSLTATEGGVDAAAKAERKVVDRLAPDVASLAGRLDLARLTINGDTLVTRRPPIIKMGRAAVTLPPNAFLQATADGEKKFSELVLAPLGKARTVADLFCGCGPFALRLAEAARVSAFDSDKSAIAALAQAVRTTSGLKPLETRPRDLFREPLVASELKAFEAVVFDPPRAGAEAQARQIAKSGVSTVVAVSCDPATLARDAAILIGGGYRIGEVTPVDQFKWTSHVEAVAVFRRN